MSLAYFCNTCWMASCYREARAYERDCQNVRSVQARLLHDIVGQNRETWFGRKYRFGSIHNVRDFQDAVPLSTYDDYRDAIERIAQGDQQVLTADRVRLFEPTGGSTSGEKLIPYTRTLELSFQRAIRVWIWDLYSQRPAARRGKSYWSISPLSQAERTTAAGIPIGFAHDASYLSRWERLFVQTTLAVPPEVAFCPSVAAAQYATLFFLLRTRNLSLISVWNPTFLTELLRVLWDRHEYLCDDLAAGRICSFSAEPSPVTRRSYRPLRRWAEQLRGIFRGTEHVSQCIPAIWPSLALVSCWSDGPASVQACNLRRLLPAVEIQPKGLLATEACVTVPLLGQAAPALALRSHFFEFQAAGVEGVHSNQQLLLARELSEGRRYRVIVTNGGGLYRYQLQDEVEVAGFKGETPLLRFVGKTDDVSDLVGEKLSAAHVDTVLQGAFRKLAIAPSFAAIRPAQSPLPGYVLEVAAPSLTDNETLQKLLCETVEQGLGANPGYRYARELGQLSVLTVDVLDQQEGEAIASQRAADRVAAGQRLGNIKPATLYHERYG